MALIVILCKRQFFAKLLIFRIRSIDYVKLTYLVSPDICNYCYNCWQTCEREKESNAWVCHQLEHFSICDEGSLQLDVQVTYSFVAGIAAICLLAYLLPDKIRPNHEKLIHIVFVSPKQFTQCDYYSCITLGFLCSRSSCSSKKSGGAIQSPLRKCVWFQSDVSGCW